jgi:hypothetical protein
MSLVSLGSGMSHNVHDARVVESLGLLAGLKAELIADILPLLEDRVNGMVPPAVYVTGPDIDVAAPQVSVAAADLSALAEAQEETNVLLRELCEAISQPLTRTVTRDKQGLITSIVDRRG